MKVMLAVALIALGLTGCADDFAAADGLVIGYDRIPSSSFASLRRAST